MSVPSMVHLHRSDDDDDLVTRNNFNWNSDAFHGPNSNKNDVHDAVEDVESSTTIANNELTAPTSNTINTISKDLPDCKVRRNYSCPRCEFFTQNPRLYLYHLRDVHHQRIKVYECPNCLYASKHFQKLLRHSKMVHGTSEGVSAAETCRDSSSLRRRRSSVVVIAENDVAEEEILHDVNVEVDEQQQQLLLLEDEVIDEEEILPADEDSVLFKCSVCAFQTRNRTQLNRHEREEHIKTKFFRCSKCTYVTHIKARYTKHVKYHSMPMIKCDMCDFRTPYKWNLDRHCKNHNGKGAFRCSACNFTADIKQSLTVHEMNHHVPPVGQAAGLGVGRRRNKVGASDSNNAAEDTTYYSSSSNPQDSSIISSIDANQIQHQQQSSSSSEDAAAINQSTIKTRPKIKITPTKKSKNISTNNGVINNNNNNNHSELSSLRGKLSDFVHPDDIIQHSNGKVYIKNKCKLCNFKTAWNSEMAKHEKQFHNIGGGGRELMSPIIKKTSRPIPNLIPIPHHRNINNEPKEAIMSQKDIRDICSRSGNSVLKDFASLFGSEDVFNASTSSSKVPDLIPTAIFSQSSHPPKNFKQKNASFFDHLKEKLELGTGCNLSCDLCGHESKCLTEQAKHKKFCGKEMNRVPNIIPVHNISASRCQYCRQRCKSSTDLHNHLQSCVEALKSVTERFRHHHQEDDTMSEHELKIDEDRQSTEDDFENNKPHPMENKVFVWNDIMVPMDIDVDDSNYEYTEDKIDDNISLDLSIRTQSPASSENNYLMQENNNNNIPSVQHSPVSVTTEKIPTHGNDISVAQHKRVFKCPHCTFWASTASRFHVHIVGHLNKKPFECSLCSYRSNWRWDITKHIKLKSVRDQAHESAKVLMTDETGRRNYTKYNKYLTEIPLSSLQSSNETSGGSGTRPKNHDRNSSPSTSRSSEKNNKFPTSGDLNSLLKISNARSPSSSSSSSRAAEKQFMSNVIQERKRNNNNNSDGRRTLFKCKKCNFRNASRDILLQHVKDHYQQQSSEQQAEQFFQQAVAAAAAAQAALSSPPSPLSLVTSTGVAASGVGASGGNPNSSYFSSQDLSLRGTSPDREERHCRLKHGGDIRVVSTKNGQEKIEIDEQPDDPEDIPFKCPHCPFNTDQTDQFDKHINGHSSSSSDYLFTCTVCQYGVDEETVYNDHIKLHSNDESKKFRCSYCPYVTNSKSQYTHHKQFHKDRGGPYTCSHCSYNVSKRHLLHQHLKVHGINVSPSLNKQQFDAATIINEDIEEIIDFSDIPLVWVSKNGKFSKMFKCRYCPHLNVRKVNIQDHEKMHANSSKNNDNNVDHKCSACNYVCNNAGVLSSHLKVHQGFYGVVHCLVDPTKNDDEQINELTKALSGTIEGIDTSEFLEVEMEELDTAAEENILHFCSECPARFLKENEFSIHRSFHNRIAGDFKCTHCTYSVDNENFLNSHLKVHTTDYQERSKILKKFHAISSSHSAPLLQERTDSNGQIWIIIADQEQKNNILASVLSKPIKSSQQVPLSGTELFLQRSEAQQQHQRQNIEIKTERIINPSPDPQLMLGNPEFVYQTYIKNGRMKEKRYKCHKCPSAFEKREQYKVHLGLHGSQQRYHCNSCDYSVKYYANFVQHLKKHKFNEDALAKKNQPEDMENFEELQIMDYSSSSGEEKKPFWCSHCPYEAGRKDSLENHQKRHKCVSGIKSTHSCEHCDYSVPQAHLCREHEKIHFIPNKISHVNGYMSCDSLKLTASNLEASTDEDNNVNNVIYEDDNNDHEDDEDDEKFNNNKGEKLNNVQSGGVLVNNKNKNSSDVIISVDNNTNIVERDVN